MFLVNHLPEIRDRWIRAFLAKDPSVALLVAATHFEWTVCRVVRLMSSTGTLELRERMKDVFGLKKYKELWRDEIARRPSGKTLPQVVPNWPAVREAFEWRNRLVHGRDRCTRNMARPRVEALLMAAAAAREYCGQEGVDFRSRVPIRRRQREQSNNGMQARAGADRQGRSAAPSGARRA